MENLAQLCKNKSLLILLCCTAAIYAGVLIVDTATETRPGALTLKYLGDVFCLLIVPASLQHAYNQRDIQLLLVAFFFILGADALFLFAGLKELGILCFCFAHLSFIRRYHGKAFVPCSATLLAVLAFYVTGKLAGWQLPYIYILSATYGALLFIVTYEGFAADFPKPNKTLVKIGMGAFILNDINNVIMYFSVPGSPANAIAAYLVWVFYLPALALLALSVYDFSTTK